MSEYGIMSPGSSTRPVIMTVGGATIASIFGGAMLGGARGAAIGGAAALGIGSLIGAFQYFKDAKDLRDCEQNPDCSSSPAHGTSEQMTTYAWGAGALGVAMSGLGIYLWRKKR